MKTRDYGTPEEEEELEVPEEKSFGPLDAWRGEGGGDR